tara:strand:+ start:3608 stop:4024 length:417 start_codon:yes stop_codon:yes gene_type:complete
MNEEKVRANIRKLLFEDNWVANATDDKSAGKFVIDADEEMPVPVAPSPQMAMQISTDHPPITDEDYIPTHATELAKSMYALFEDCPSDQIEYIYRQAHRLRAHAEERSSKFKVAESEVDDSIPLPKPVKKSTSRPERV